MKSIRMSMLLLIMVAVLRLLSGCATCGDCEFMHFVDVYITEDQEIRTLENDKPIAEIFLFEGDIFIINNRASETVTVKFPEGMFEITSKDIKPNKRLKLKVLKAGPVGAGLTTIKGGNTIDGVPTMKVGEEP